LHDFLTDILPWSEKEAVHKRTRLLSEIWPFLRRSSIECSESKLVVWNLLCFERLKM